MRLLAAALLVLVSFSAFAADVTWSWTNPTQNVDNSAIPATGVGSLNGGRLEFGTCGTGGAFGTKAGEIPLTQAQITAHAVTQTNLLPSTVCGRVYVRNTYGNESAASNVASVVIAPPTPKPATGLTAQEAVAYEMRPQRDGTLRAVRLGLIPLPTYCGPDRVVAGGIEYHRIELTDIDVVNWPANTRELPTAWAVCS